jgi:hypothetical protein
MQPLERQLAGPCVHEVACHFPLHQAAPVTSVTGAA